MRRVPIPLMKYREAITVGREFRRATAIRVVKKGDYFGQGFIRIAASDARGYNNCLPESEGLRHGKPIH